MKQRVRLMTAASKPTMPVINPPTMAGSISLYTQYEIETNPSEISAKTSCQIIISILDAVSVLVPSPLILIVKFPPCVDIPLMASFGTFSRSKTINSESSSYAAFVLEDT